MAGSWVVFKTSITLLRMVQINKPKWDAWKMLPEAVKSGAVPFALAHGGLDMHQVRPTLPGPCCMQTEPCALNDGILQKQQH